MKRLFRYVVRLEVLVLLIVFLTPVCSQAGFMDKMNKSISDGRQKMNKSINRTKDRAREKKRDLQRKADRKKREMRDRGNRKKQELREAAQRKKQQAQKRARQKKRELEQRAQKKKRFMEQKARRQKQRLAEKSRQKKREMEQRAQQRKRQLEQEARKRKQQALRAAEQQKRRAENSFRNKKNAFAQKRERAQQNVRKSAGRASDRAKTAFRENKNRQVNKAYGAFQKQVDRLGIQKRRAGQSVRNLESNMRKAAKRYGSKAERMINNSKERYGRQAAQVMAAQMARAEKDGVQAAQKTKSLLNDVSKRVRNPRNREKVLHGAAVAGGIAYYAYSHKDDMKYKAIRYGMDNVSVTVNGRKKSASSLVSDAIISQAPALQGTRIAEDPAAVMAYGVVAVGKDDLINRVELVPDGHGGTRTVRETIRTVDRGEDAIAALQMSSSIEGMAMSAADRGDLGRYGEDFAASYNVMEGTFGE